MTELPPNQPEKLDEEPTPEAIGSGQVISLLRDLKAEGLEVDFEEEDIDHIQPMDEEEALDYLIASLLSAGVDDPEAYLKGKAILE